jgi:hypothetical protein
VPSRLGSQTLIMQRVLAVRRLCSGGPRHFFPPVLCNCYLGLDQAILTDWIGGSGFISAIIRASW